jgi:lipopolysaccharide transport protein LptA
LQQEQFKNASPLRIIFAFALIIALGAAFTSAPGYAQDEKSAPKGDSAGKPIKISADRLDSNPVEKYAEFIGNVKATQAEYEITSNSLRIYYDGDLINREKGSSGADMLKKIVASGNVEVHSDQFAAKTERLEYDFKAQKLELSGRNSTITMGKNSISGSKITYYRAEERFKVEGGSEKRVNVEFFSDSSDSKVSDMFDNQKTDKKSE